MHTAIRKWILREGLKHTADKYNVTKREVRRAKFRQAIRSQDQVVKSIAYGIATKIKQRGLKRTNFMSKAIAKAEVNARKEIAAGFKIDIIESLPKKL